MDERKIVSGAVAFLIVAVCALPAFAGTVYTNDSGITAKAFRIVFSEPVTITSFGDTFATQEPEGEADKFVFSGGEAKTWDSIWLTWEPSSAKVVKTEWLADVPVVASPEELPSEIMSEIPVSLKSSDGEAVLEGTIRRYVSHEQIPFTVRYEPEFSSLDDLTFKWFTPAGIENVPIIEPDLESNFNPLKVKLEINDSNGRLYVWNDEVDVPLHNLTSITLNATKFVPEDEIKSVTWTAKNGDPADAATFPIADPNSPVTTLRSEWPNVLDIGCEIEKKDGTVVDKDIEALIYFKDGTPFEDRGTGATLFEPGTLIDLHSLLPEMMDLFKKLGINTIVTAIDWRYGAPDDNGVFRIHPIYSHPDPRGYSPRLEDLQFYFNEAKENSFRVDMQLRQFPYLDDVTLQQNYHNSGWGKFAGFMQTDGWLYGEGEGLENALLYYLDFFVESDVDTVFLDAEQGQVEEHGGRISRNFFNDIIKKYREAGFEGDIFYGLNYWYNPSGTMAPLYLNNLNPSKSGIPWNNMDVIGLTFYPKLADTKDASTGDMYKEALRQVNKYLVPLSKTYGKQLYIEECSCKAFDGCAVNTLQSSDKIDKEEQRRWSTAWLRAFTHFNQTSQPLFKGIMMQSYRILQHEWMHDLQPLSEGLGSEKLNVEVGGLGLQKLMQVYFSNKPRVSPSK